MAMVSCKSSLRKGGEILDEPDIMHSLQFQNEFIVMSGFNTREKTENNALELTILGNNGQSFSSHHHKEEVILDEFDIII